MPATISTLSGSFCASKSFDGLGLRHLLADDDVVLGDDPPHLGLDLLEVLGRERPARVEVVVEAVLDRGADPDLHAREEALDRVRAEVRRGVAVELERVGVLRRDDLELAGRRERPRQVEHLRRPASRRGRPSRDGARSTPRPRGPSCPKAPHEPSHRAASTGSRSNSPPQTCLPLFPSQKDLLPTEEPRCQVERGW